MVNQYRRAWIDALRSGKYRQCERVLQKDGSYCALGLAALVCDDVIEEGQQTLNPETMKKLGLYTEEGCINYTQSITTFNDENGLTFEEIANIIEGGNVPYLFLPDEETLNERRKALLEGLKGLQIDMEQPMYHKDGIWSLAGAITKLSGLGVWNEKQEYCTIDRCNHEAGLSFQVGHHYGIDRKSFAVGYNLEDCFL